MLYSIQKLTRSILARSGVHIMAMHHIGLSPIQEQFIQALLTGKSITDAAQLLKIGRRTATLWMKDNHPVRLEYEHVKREQSVSIRAGIQEMHTMALDALKRSL